MLIDPILIDTLFIISNHISNSNSTRSIKLRKLYFHSKARQLLQNLKKKKNHVRRWKIENRSCRFEARLKPIDQPRKKQLHVRSRIQPEGEFIKLPLKFSFTRQFTSSRFLRGCTDRSCRSLHLRPEFFRSSPPRFKSLIFHRNNSPPSHYTENEEVRLRRGNEITR